MTLIRCISPKPFGFILVQDFGHSVGVGALVKGTLATASIDKTYMDSSLFIFPVISYSPWIALPQWDFSA